MSTKPVQKGYVCKHNIFFRLCYPYQPYLLIQYSKYGNTADICNGNIRSEYSFGVAPSPHHVKFVERGGTVVLHRRQDRPGEREDGGADSSGTPNIRCLSISKVSASAHLTFLATFGDQIERWRRQVRAALTAGEFYTGSQCCSSV